MEFFRLLGVPKEDPDNVIDSYFNNDIDFKHFVPCRRSTLFVPYHSD